MVGCWVNKRTQIQAQIAQMHGREEKRRPGEGRKPLREELLNLALK